MTLSNQVCMRSALSGHDLNTNSRDHWYHPLGPQASMAPRREAARSIEPRFGCGNVAFFKRFFFNPMKSPSTVACNASPISKISIGCAFLAEPTLLRQCVGFFSTYLYQHPAEQLRDVLCKCHDCIRFLGRAAS